jgi:hypothetical protein
MAAGVIPFCVRDGGVHFLFHQTFSGRRAGYLVDFGGGGRDGESYRQTAIREFIEETETMYFSADVRGVIRSEARVKEQVSLLERLFERTLGEHPDWWCQRTPGKKIPPKDWRTFFIEIDCRDPADMNREWEEDAGRRFSKRRLLLWLPAAELLDIYANAPQRLWKRVRQLEGASDLIRDIVESKTDG